MAFLFFGHMTEKAASDCVAAADQLANNYERVTELVAAYNRMKDVILFDTVRITESLLDATGMSDLERTLWETEYPKEDDSMLPGEGARQKAAEAAKDRKAAAELTKQMNEDSARVREIGFVLTGFYQELAMLDSKMVLMNDSMRKIIKNRGTSFAEYNTEDISLFRRANATSEKLRGLMSIRVIDENGVVTETALKRSEELLAER